jgi:serine/threonine protein kinase
MSMIGKSLAHYEISGRLGKGGIGEVYQAMDRKLGRDVVIKVLTDEFARDADRVARFHRKAYQLLEELLMAARNTYVPAFWIAMVDSGLGEIEECLNWRHKGAEQRESGILNVFLCPSFNLLRSHPHYHVLRRKMNLQSESSRLIGCWTAVC